MNAEVSYRVMNNTPEESPRCGQVRHGGAKEEKRSLLEVVIMTDSNGRNVRPDLIKEHIPKEQRDGLKIRIEVVYTLAMAHEKLKKGALSIAGAMVILDVGTNDVRGTNRAAQLEQNVFRQRYEGVIRLLREKGAGGVVGCELKGMSFMDVQPYSNVIHSLCVKLGIRGVRTRIGISHLAQDGYHILPSCLGVLAQTYALAILGLLPEEVLDGAVPPILAPVVEGPRFSWGVGGMQAFPNVPTGRGEPQDRLVDIMGNVGKGQGTKTRVVTWTIDMRIGRWWKP